VGCVPLACGADVVGSGGGAGEVTGLWCGVLRVAGRESTRWGVHGRFVEAGCGRRAGTVRGEEGW